MIIKQVTATHTLWRYSLQKTAMMFTLETSTCRSLTEITARGV